MSVSAKRMQHTFELKSMCYLHLPSGTMVSMFEPGRYPDMFKIASGGFYIHEQVLRRVNLKGPSDDAKVYIIKDDVYFEAFYNDWLANRGSWYRGVNCSHFSYGAIVKGEMASEGMQDVPSFTMSESVKTRWLPGCCEHNLCTVPAISNTDGFTDVLAKTFHVPVAIVVKVVLGRDNERIPVAWMNSGEQVIRGPLRAQDFSFESIVWLCHGFPKVTNFPPFLVPPPERPYMPGGQEVINSWWKDSGQVWVDGVDLIGGYQCFLRRS